MRYQLVLLCCQTFDPDNASGYTLNALPAPSTLDRSRQLADDSSRPRQRDRIKLSKPRLRFLSGKLSWPEKSVQPLRVWRIVLCEVIDVRN